MSSQREVVGMLHGWNADHIVGRNAKGLSADSYCLILGGMLNTRVNKNEAPRHQIASDG